MAYDRLWSINGDLTMSCGPGLVADDGLWSINRVADDGLWSTSRVADGGLWSINRVADVIQ